MIQKCTSGIIVLSCLLLTGFHSLAQTVEWVSQLGGTNATGEVGRCVAVDDAGNVYSTGFFNGTDFNPGTGMPNLASAGGSDIYVVKQDPSGAAIWAKRFGGSGADIGYGIRADRYGHIYLTGQVTGTVVFDAAAGGTVTASGADIFVLKLDTAGNFKWVRNMGGTSTDYAFKIALDPWDGVYTAGGFVSTNADFDPGPANYPLASKGGNDLFISKLDTAGNFIWAKQIGGTGDDIAYSLATDAGGNVYATGEFKSATVDFDPGTDVSQVYNLSNAASGLADVFIVKLDSGGHFVWATKVGSGNADVAYSVATDKDCNVIVSGSFIGTVAFGPYSMSASIRDVFITKLDSSGKFLWARSFETGGGTGHCVAVDASGNVYSSGNFVTYAIFDPSTGVRTNASGGSGFDGYVSRMDAAGKLEWVVTMGGAGEETTYNLVTDAAGNIYSTGYFKSATAYFTPFTLTMKGASGGDVFVHKISAPAGCIPTYASLNPSACDSFILNGTTYKTGGAHTQQLVNAAGCDSILTINLTLRTSTSRLLTEVACERFTLNGTVYTTSGTYTQKRQNAAGCDSTITLDLTINQPSSSNITESACDSFVLDGTAYKTSGIYTQTLRNSSGCDSLVTLDLTILRSDSTIRETACDSFLYDGMLYLTGGSYRHVFRNAAGCDSVVTLNLTIRQSNGSTITETACDSLWFDNIRYNKTGIYTHRFVNVSGCDSIVTLDLTIGRADVSVIRAGTLLTAALGATSYQWLDCSRSMSPVPGAQLQIFEAPQSGGRYAVEVIAGICRDTSACIEIEPEGISVYDNLSLIRIYPNPAKAKVTIYTPGESLQGVGLRLLGISGNLLSEQSLMDGNRFDLDIADIPTGIYLLEVRKNGRTITRKIVKE